MKSLTAFIVLVCIVNSTLFAQGEIDDEDKIFYRTERTYAATLSSLGLGGGYRYAKRITGFKKTIYLLEYSQLKNYKEIKIPSSNAQQIGGGIVNGKLNALGTIRMGVGLQNEIFQKRDRGGISIRYLYSGGVSLGIQKPVYYEITQIDTSGSKIVKLDEEDHLAFNQIVKSMPFYVGLSEIKLVPGIYVKLGASFEFSKTDNVFHALETGVIIDVFYRKVPIMANDYNYWLYPAFYLSYRFGRVVDTQFKTKLNKIDKALVN